MRDHRLRESTTCGPILFPARRDAVLFIEYDVGPSGDIELVALINAVEEEGRDPDGTAWLAWRRSEFDDDGLGCVAVPPDDLARLERTQDADELRKIVEGIILADRAIKEDLPT
jgi:hypothetical protein